MNIYRGCSHGCVYCDSRSRCYQFTHPFEDIEVKRNAPELLEAALKSKRKRCMIGTGSMSDPYMHCEEELGLTRKCLEIILRYGFGAAVITKSDRILRDIDLLEEINRESKCVVQMTLTTYDDDLCRILEPNVCNTKRRIEVLEEMRDRGIPTMVWLTPILPFINDTEENIRSILDACIRVGVRGIICFDMGLTLRAGDREYYYAALDKYFPGMMRTLQKSYTKTLRLQKSHDLVECFAAFQVRVHDRVRLDPALLLLQVLQFLGQPVIAVLEFGHIRFYFCDLGIKCISRLLPCHRPVPPCS